jgi:BirA family biotin operon repressor/biotin-[acetyl-CoA-carboxylase] ligase
MREETDRNLWVDRLAGAIGGARRIMAAEEEAPPASGSSLKIEGVEAVIDGDDAVHLFPGRTEWGSQVIMGSELLFYDVIASTNDRTRGLIEAEAPTGSVVLAETQLAGKGRHGRVWHSPAGGGLYFTSLLRPEIGPDLIGWVTLSACLALVRAGKQLGAMLTIKWPNDVQWEGKKVAGMLAEAFHEGDRLKAICLGTGINVTWDPGQLPPEIREQATALSICTPAIVDRDTLLASFLWEYDSLYEELEAGEGETPSIASEVMAHMTQFGEPVQVKTADGVIEGICTGLSREGYLELAGGRTVASGELMVPMPEKDI